MFTIKFSEDGKKAAIDLLEGFEDSVSNAAARGLKKIGKDVYRRAHNWLSGAKTNTGAYPVPVVTGNLRRLLDWLKPGESKTSGDVSLAAGDIETIIYDSASYAHVVFLGKGSSAKFGKRHAIIDAFNEFNKEYSIEDVLEDELGGDFT